MHPETSHSPRSAISPKQSYQTPDTDAATLDTIPGYFLCSFFERLRILPFSAGGAKNDISSKRVSCLRYIEDRIFDVIKLFQFDR
jgi:hypothetical protein